MEQIFYNLLSNAVKFTPEGGKVEMLIENKRIKDGYVSYDSIVRDSGIGMTREFQEHMFEAFTQEANNVTPDYKGSGLGLAIVKQLVDLMGGRISVKSSLGKGTEFTVHCL
jgi:signal transduction histidine kinase